MGYYTSYTLSADTGYEHLIEELREENEHANYAIDSNGLTAESTKWYDHQKDMRAFSKKHPEVLFTLEGIGEEQPDVWVEYYMNGKMQKVVAKVTFEPFNESLLS